MVIMLSLLLLLAVTAMSLNVRSGMQTRMAANRTVDAQTYLDQLAVIEQSVWKLTGDPSWRTVAAGEDYLYQGRTYNRKVSGPDTATYPALAAYRDAVIISVQSLNAARTVNKSFRYNISTPLLPPVTKPRQVCADSTGNIYFADMDNHRVWKINVSGTVTPVAGTGASGFSGDGGLATNAMLNSPQGVAVDGSGNIFYIADTGNRRIRTFTVGGNISTVAGTGLDGDWGNNVKALKATLKEPSGIAVDGPGNIYFADTGNHRIGKMPVADNQSRQIYLVAGTGVGGYSGDGVLATNAMLNSPQGVAVDVSGNIYIADTLSHRIRKVAAATGIISTVAGITGNYSGPYLPLGDGGDATAAQLNNPHSVWMDASGIYIADTGNHRIRKFMDGGAISTVAGTVTAGHTGDGGAPANARIDFPTGVCGNAQMLVISDTMNSCLRKVQTGVITTWPAATEKPGLNKPKGIAAYYDVSGKKLFLFIADQDNHRVRRLDTETNAIDTIAGTGIAGSAGDNGPATAAQINSPSGVAVDTSGNIYVADTNNQRIRQFTVGGNIVTVAGTGIAGPAGDNGPATAAQINSPTGVAVDTSQNIYIADRDNNRIRKFTVGGSITTVAGNGTAGYAGDGGAATSAKINSPQGVSVDGAGNIYIADTGNHALRLVNIHTGLITTMAGDDTNTNNGYNGDNQPAVQAWLRSPGGVALGLTKGGGRIYISDTGNNRVRVLLLKTAKEVYGP